MADGVVVACIDGSDRSRAAVAAGLALLGAEVDVLLVTVVPPSDPMLVSGTGFAGGTMSAAELEALEGAQREAAVALLDDATHQLGLAGARTQVLDGPTGPAICDLADREQAVAVVIGSRGQGGFKRAMLGSVSDHVVRNAACPVVVTTVEG